jgi:subtilisin family serine protease/predicted enzyme related to lactoylglutathione lyase
MVLRTIRSLLAIVLSVCLVSSQTMGGWDVGILRAAKKAGGNKPEIADSPAQKNTPPKISKIADRIIAKNGVATATYLVNDAESPAGALRVAAISDNPDFLPNDRLVVTANGGERTLTATPLSDKEGIATITVTVTDGGGVKTSTNFSLTAKVDLPYVPGEIIVTYKTGVTPSALFPMPSSQGSVKSPSAQKAGMGLPAIRPLLRNPKRAATQRSSAQSLGRRSLRVSLGGDELSAKSLETLHRTYVLTFDSTQDVQNIKEALQRDPEVEIVQLNNVCSIEALDDPYFTEGKLWGLDQVHASSAWEMARGDGVVVAVVDSGIDATHSDLAVNVWTNPNETPENGIDDDANGFIDDVHGWNFVGHNNAPVDGNGHGTHVSGTIAAVGENGRGVIGLAYKAKIMPLKGMDDNGVGNIVDLANALMYAADNGADVVNASWGGNFPCASNSVIASAVQYAYGKGVTVVAAAGNSNSDVAGFTPAGCPNVISVAATDIGDGKAYFSNWGKIDVAAPGMGIISTVPGNIYGSKNGTSMACPHVSGLAALVLSKFPSYTNVQVRELIRSSSSDVGEEGFDPYFGYGRINAAKALSVNLETEPPTAPSNLNATTFPLLVKLTWTASSDNVEVKGYFLDVSSNADFSSFIETFNNLWLGNVTSQNIGGLVPSSTYYIRIRARDRVGNISSYSPVLRVTTSGPNMLPPSVNLRALKPTAMLVNWTPANNTIKEIAYLIQASTNSQFTSFSFSKPINVVHRNVLIENLQPKTTYYVRGLVYGEGWAVSAFGPTVVETTGDDQKTGTLDVISTPPGAWIYLKNNNGTWSEFLQVTPVTFKDLSEGTYEMKLVKSGYTDWVGTGTIMAGGTVTLNATLTSTTTGTITVNSTPAGAQIYYSYNGGAWTDTGVTTPYTFTNLAVGTYKAKLVKAGYVDGETALQTLTAGGALTMGATLTPATGSITVNSTPAGAQIYYSYNSGAWTDTGVTAPYTFTGLAVGTYKAKLVKAGYVDGETALQTLTAGGSLTMGATLTAATGNITVNSTPAGARIYYSYNSGAWTDTGVTAPYTFTGLAVGTYKAKLVKAGYVDGETALQTLTAGGALTMGATLTPATGSITVNSTPAGAQIYYSYNSGAWTDTGVTAPYTFTGLAVGTYKAKLVKAGYVDGETALQTLTAGGSLTMGATLTPATGSITVNSTPAGARIYYSYNSGAWTDTGVTTPYTFTGLAVGTYKAKLVKAGYVDGETALQTLTAGGALTMGATLTPATGSITVNSTPAGARIYYSYNSGAWTDTGITTPYTFTGLAVGTYKAKLVKAGYVDGETALQTLTAGGALTMGATLTPATGSITVNSTPAGARIYYSYNSGAWTDTGITTPYTFTGLAVGTYKAKLVKAGYVDGETALQTLTAGGALTMGATLTPATGSITVNSTPAGAQIYYSYNSGAWTDTGVTAPNTFTNLAVGTYKAKLVKAGYVDGETALQTLTAGGALTMGATLTPATGSITVNSTPAGAQIYYSYNGGAWTDTGVSTPYTFTNLAVGTYKAKLVKAGYVDGETALQTLTAGGSLTMGATLTAATGSITVNSTPAGARIYYSYNSGAWTDTGVTTPYTFTGLAVGTYKAKLVKAGYVDGETALQTLTAGGALTMGATLTPATGSITVNSTPAGARIYYSYNSGAWTDTGVTTPYTFTGLAVGTYKAKLVKAGYVDGETALQTLTAGGALTMGATLTPATGSITVNSTPAGARIYYSYNSGAWTDTGVSTPYTFTNLAVGTYKAKLVKAGYVDGETALQTLTAGGALTMGATLTPATGSITVNSTPAGARIYYSYNSGAWTDTGITTPYTFTGLAVGTYKAKLVKAGYVDGETALQTLTAGGSLTMGATLTAATGNITVNSTPAGAQIYYSYNGGAWTDTGVSTPYTFTNLAVGTYKAKLVKAGYVDGETAPADADGRWLADHGGNADSCHGEHHGEFNTGGGADLLLLQQRSVDGHGCHDTVHVHGACGGNV